MKQKRLDARCLDLTMPFYITMARGRRSVPVGRFPSRQRAPIVASALGWGGWKPRVTLQASPTEERP
jgi:hypothetical protein